MYRDWYTMAKLRHLSETTKVFGLKCLHNQNIYRKFAERKRMILCFQPQPEDDRVINDIDYDRDYE